MVLLPYIKSAFVRVLLLFRRGKKNEIYCGVLRQMPAALGTRVLRRIM